MHVIIKIMDKFFSQVLAVTSNASVYSTSQQTSGTNYTFGMSSFLFALVVTFTLGMIVLGIAFLVRWWLVQSAMFRIDKGIKEINSKINSIYISAKQDSGADSDEN
jgi:uncharacterized membrane protein YciS (DUF1049 family)